MTNQTNSAWTPELKERVKVLWATHSATEIAGVFHGEGYTFTRNAVIGVLHRANLTSAHKDEEHPSSHTAPKRRPKAGAEDIKLRCVEIVCATDFNDVTGCWYPEGNGPFLFCNGERMPGSSYCVPHFHLCRDEGTISERLATKGIAA